MWHGDSHCWNRNQVLRAARRLLSVTCVSPCLAWRNASMPCHDPWTMLRCLGIWVINVDMSVRCWCLTDVQPKSTELGSAKSSYIHHSHFPKFGCLGIDLEPTNIGFLNFRTETNQLILSASPRHPLCESPGTRHGIAKVPGDLSLLETHVICLLHYRLLWFYIQEISNLWPTEDQRNPINNVM